MVARNLYHDACKIEIYQLYMYDNVIETKTKVGRPFHLKSLEEIMSAKIRGN
jgi:hypothetical protein